MGDREPETEMMDIAAARERWDELLDQVARGASRVIVAEDGRPVAAIISAADFAWLVRREAERAERFKVLDAISAAFADVPDDEIEREVAKAIANVRAQARAMATASASDA
jgi:prevent-host-death family protein